MNFIIATKNAHKVREFSRILIPLNITALSENDLKIAIPDVEETGSTFAQNAYLKAMSAYKASGLPSVADDSGLCVDALDGAPGVYSARFAGEGASDKERIEKLLYVLKDVPKEQRTAHFVSSICCVIDDNTVITAEGICEGFIDFEPHGENGFGYDPVFMYDGMSFAQMSGEQKDRVSHRGRALKSFAQKLKDYLNGGSIQ